MDAWDTVFGQRTMQGIQTGMEHLSDIDSDLQEMPTRRDWFAAQALNSFLNNCMENLSDNRIELVVDAAYRVADAMEVRRNK